MMFHCVICGKKLDESNFYTKVKNKCKDCLNKKFKCELCGKFFTEKGLTTHIEREHRDQKLIILTLRITIEHFWLVVVFGVRHNLC